mmetsp:Transcript_77402/g.218876  ORF Transcript_77402/g.218876 Transcript_77402/m.218876 type:complete len:281 (+) Transcript_77402:296-1138(+)
MNFHTWSPPNPACPGSPPSRTGAPRRPAPAGSASPWAPRTCCAWRSRAAAAPVAAASRLPGVSARRPAARAAPPHAASPPFRPTAGRSSGSSGGSTARAWSRGCLAARCWWSGRPLRSCHPAASAAAPRTNSRCSSSGCAPPACAPGCSGAPRWSPAGAPRPTRPRRPAPRWSSGRWAPASSSPHRTEARARWRTGRRPPWWPRPSWLARAWGAAACWNPRTWPPSSRGCGIGRTRSAPRSTTGSGIGCSPPAPAGTLSIPRGAAGGSCARARARAGGGR